MRICWIWRTRSLVLEGQVLKNAGLCYRNLRVIVRTNTHSEIEGCVSVAFTCVNPTYWTFKVKNVFPAYSNILSLRYTRSQITAHLL